MDSGNRYNEEIAEKRHLLFVKVDSFRESGSGAEAVVAAGDINSPQTEPARTATISEKEL